MGDTVYIITNESMPDLVKIGITSNPIEQRLKELNNTSVPLPFSCYYAAEVENAAHVEKVLHAAYDDSRINPNREFFSISPEAARAILKEFEISDRTVREQFENEAEEAAFKRVAKVKSFFDFTELNIKPGEVLEFTRDSNITATVHDDSTINFNGTNITQSSRRERSYYLLPPAYNLLATSYYLPPTACLQLPPTYYLLATTY